MSGPLEVLREALGHAEDWSGAAFDAVVCDGGKDRVGLDEHLIGVRRTLGWLDDSMCRLAPPDREHPAVKHVVETVCLWRLCLGHVDSPVDLRTGADDRLAILVNVRMDACRVVLVLRGLLRSLEAAGKAVAS